ncbi:hypothetical protein AVEN_116329-1 [Araneus ventricosus]|uniref:Uncharacterized protein n=1 Tax=Araneus ventricosus TaxID=182803 RepID=A0A4Y2RBK5_ARAVE|nr:hypothetical protein AVEN_253630-1 [Araneus ventricosus]GBN72885.1 hypothetical protein AVEN_116329-1 [Araneus ventricosus]
MSTLSNSWGLNLQEAYWQFYRRVRKYRLSPPPLPPDLEQEGSKSESRPSCIEPVARLIIRVVPNVLPSVWCGSLESGVPGQVSSSSSDRSSDLRVPSKITLLQLQNGTLI